MHVSKAEQALLHGCVGGGKGGGGGGGEATCLVAKQAVEFPQVLLASYHYYHYDHSCKYLVVTFSPDIPFAC